MVTLALISHDYAKVFADPVKYGILLTFIRGQVMSEQALLVQKYVKIMAKHPGKWLAIHNDEVVGVAGDLDTLLDKVKGFKGVFIVYSPTPEEQRQAYLI